MREKGHTKHKMKEIDPEIIEYGKYLNQRGQPFGKFLIQKANEMRDGEKMAFVGHQLLIRSMYATEFNELDHAINGVDLKNCEI